MVTTWFYHKFCLINHKFDSVNDNRVRNLERASANWRCALWLLCVEFYVCEVLHNLEIFSLLCSCGRWNVFTMHTLTRKHSPHNGVQWQDVGWFTIVGQNVPENMPRCVNNNYTFTGFWRSWHSSFNTWTIRYLYLPLGGRKTQYDNCIFIIPACTHKNNTCSPPHRAHTHTPSLSLSLSHTLSRSISCSHLSIVYEDL